MKIVRQFKPVRGKLAKQHSELRRREPKILQKALRDEYQHTFQIVREDEKTLISWDLGPCREEVWQFIVTRFPELAAEVIMASLWEGGCEMYDGYMSFPMPSSLKRRDLFNARVEDIAYLATLGAEMDVEGYNGTPLDNAVMRRDDRRAVALAKAGADVSDYGPDGSSFALAYGLPGLFAFIEGRQISASVSDGLSPDRPRKRL